MDINQLKRQFAESENLKSLIDVRNRWIARHLNPLKDRLNEADGELKRVLGQQFNEMKDQIDALFNSERTRFEGVASTTVAKKWDFSICNFELTSASFNPISEIRTILIDYFHSLGFKIEGGREIVSTKENFLDLNVPGDHPSWSPKETFYVGEDYILRPHCTVNSAIVLKANPNKDKCSLKVATIGCVYRRDDETAKHTHQFTQLDFIWLQKELTVPNLKYFLENLMHAVFGDSRRYRFRNSYFPFTQPSVELDVSCSCSGHHDCKICGGSGWIEVLGAGLFRKDILSKFGYDGKYECIAGGLGLERLALIKYGIEDIRFLYSGDLEFLKNKHDY